MSRRPAHTAGRALWPATFLTILGCNSGYLQDSETDVVVTIRDGTRDFSNFDTFAMPPQVVALCSPTQRGAEGMGGVGSESDDCNELEAQWSALVLGELRAHLVAVGYREVTEEERPDLMLFVGAVTGSEWDLSTPPTYCSDGGELFAGCWRATYSHPYNLPQNTVLIDLAVGKESRRGQLKSIWTAILQGFDPSAAAKNAELQIRAVVERAFTQSPYLQAEGAL